MCAWRKGHGNGKGVPRIEVMPADEQPAAQPGTVKRGGATKIKLARNLILPQNGAWGDLSRMAEAFRKHQQRELARNAGGFCGAAPAAMLASAALQLAASRWMFAEGAKEGNMNMLRAASALANDSRQNLMAAWEMAQKEAGARKAWNKIDPHQALADALVAELPVHKPAQHGNNGGDPGIGEIASAEGDDDR